MACSTAAGAALVGAVEEGQGPCRAERVGLVAVVGWKREKRDMCQKER